MRNLIGMGCVLALTLAAQADSSLKRVSTIFNGTLSLQVYSSGKFIGLSIVDDAEHRATIVLNPEQITKFKQLAATFPMQKVAPHQTLVSDKILFGNAELQLKLLGSGECPLALRIQKDAVEEVFLCNKEILARLTDVINHPERPFERIVIDVTHPKNGNTP